jgi:hypothetical protein
MGGCVCSSELPQTAWKEGLTDAEVILIMSILDPFQVFERDHMDEFVLDAIEEIHDPTKIEKVIKSSAAAKIIICKRLIDMNDLSTKSSLTQKKLDNFIISYLSNKELYEDVLLALIQLVSGGLLPMLELSPTKYLVPAYDEVKVSDFRGLKFLTDGSPYPNENENENIRIMMACMEKLDNCPQQWITLYKSLETQIEKGIINLKSLIALDKLEILKSLSMTFPVVRMPKLNMNYLTMAHKAGDIGVVSALMMKMHLEEIPIDLLESILLEDDNRDGIDKSLGSKVWEKISQRADEAYGGKGIHLLDGLDVMNACLKLVPVLRSGRGVNCALDIRSKTLPCDIDTKEIQMIWKKQKLIYVDPCTVDLRVCTSEN